jgi:hypothetical protein
MKKVLWVKFGWSDYYQGGLVDGNFTTPKGIDGKEGAGEWHEAFNFYPGPDGTYYCYAPPQGNGYAPNSNEPNGWTVICLAKKPKQKGIHIVGWFENATLQGERRDNAPEPRTDITYCITSKNAYFVPPQSRTKPFSDPSVGSAKYSYLMGPDVENNKTRKRVLGLLERRMKALAPIAVKNPRADFAGPPKKEAAKTPRQLAVKEIHLVVNKVDDNGDALNVHDITETHFTSGFWRIARKHLQNDIVIALHRKKAVESFLQGVLEGSKTAGKGHAGAVELVVRRTNQPLQWRGSGARDRAYWPGEAQKPRRKIPPFDPSDASTAELKKRIVELRNARQGQPEFRSALMDAYGAKCAVTGSAIKPLLEAAHIIPYADNGKNSCHVQNGILLRTDIHTLFDRQFIAFRPVKGGIEIQISASLRHKEYQQFDGGILCPPAYEDQFPSLKALNIRLKRLPLVEASET